MADTAVALRRASRDGASVESAPATEHPLALAAIGACALVMALSPLVSYPPGLRAPAGLVLTLIGPGYAGLALLRPRVLTPWLHAALSVPTSFAVVVIGSAVLDATPGGVTGSRITVGIALITLALLAGWLFTGRGTAARATPRQSRRSFPHLAAAAALALALAWAAFALVRAARVDREPRYTSLFASQARGDVGQPAGTSTLRLGVVNREASARSYQLTVWTGSATHQRPPTIVWVSLRRGERWSGRVSVPCATDALVGLQSPGAPVIHRRLVLRPSCGHAPA
jgi:hypothetical protein